MSNETEQALMRFNIEYHKLLESKEFITGKKVLWCMNKVRTLRFKDIILFILRDRPRYKRLVKAYGVDSSTTFHDYYPLHLSEDCDKTFTIYTCITGNYDSPKMPLVIPSNYKFVLFSDSITESIGWDVRPIPSELKDKYDNSEINRYIKMHPASYFNTDYSLYVDGNVQLVAGIASFLDKDTCKTGIWMFNHPTRNCLFQEADACLIIKKGNSIGISKQIARYTEEGMPRNYGLKEATVILTDLKNNTAAMLLDQWWNEFYNSSGKRDQLALPYILWKNGMSVTEIGNLGDNIRSDMHFIISDHKII